MYCPKCFNDSLSLCGHGVVNIIINGKQMDAGRFLYNLERQNAQAELACMQNTQNCENDLEDCYRNCSRDPDSAFTCIGIVINDSNTAQIVSDCGVSDCLAQFNPGTCTDNCIQGCGTLSCVRNCLVPCTDAFWNCMLPRL